MNSLMCEKNLEESKIRSKEVSLKQEKVKRISGCTAIKGICGLLNLGLPIVEKSCYFFHQYYQHNCISDVKRYETAGIAVMLTAKMMALDDTTAASSTVKPFKVFEAMKKEIFNKSATQQEYNSIRDEIMVKQTEMLAYTGFEFSEPTAVEIVKEWAQKIGMTNQQMSTTAFLSANCYVMTTMCLSYPPKHIAAMSLYIFLKWNKLKITKDQNSRPFWYHLDKNLSEDILIKMSEEYIEVLNSKETGMIPKVRRLRDNDYLKILDEEKHNTCLKRRRRS